MSSAAPLILAGAALLLVSAKGKKKSGGTAVPPAADKKPSYSLPKNVVIPQLYGPLATTAPTTTNSSFDWTERQKALFAISQIQFSIGGGKTVYLCAKCDPKGADGNPGSDTTKAVKAFQALAGITPTGNWGQQEDVAMFIVIQSFNDGIHIPCDPLATYPSPLACFIQAGGGYGLEPSIQDEPAPPKPSSDDSNVDPSEPADDSPNYGPDELLVTDRDCNYIEHQDDAFFGEQNKLIIMSALDGLTDNIAAEEIHEEMMSRYIPMCLFLGREKVGQGVLTWWNTNLAHVASKLKSYDLLPELLEEDAVKYGLS